MKRILELLCDDWKTMFQALLILVAFIALALSTIQSIKTDLQCITISKSSSAVSLDEGQYIIKRAKQIIVKNKDGKAIGFIFSTPCLVNLYVEKTTNDNLIFKFIVVKPQ